MDYYNSRQIANVMATISKMLPASANVVRDGREFKAPAVDLVPGDLVHLTIGELQVPKPRTAVQAALNTLAPSLTMSARAVLVQATVCPPTFASCPLPTSRLRCRR